MQQDSVTQVANEINAAVAGKEYRAPRLTALGDIHHLVAAVQGGNGNDGDAGLS